MGPFSKNFDFNLRRDIKLISYERRDYESVDENSTSLGYVQKKKTKKRIQEVKG